MFRLALYSPLLSPFGTRECHKIQPSIVGSLPLTEGHCQLNQDCSKFSTIIPESAGALRPCGRIQPSNLSPILNTLAQLFAVSFRSELMLFRMKVVSNRSKSRKKSLGLSRRFESSHSPFPDWCGLMRVLRSIVQSLVLSMLHVWHPLFLRRFVALQFVRHNHPWHEALFLQQFAKESFCRIPQRECVVEPDAVTDDFAGESVTGVHEQGVANAVESVRLFYFPVNLTIPL